MKNEKCMRIFLYSFESVLFYRTFIRQTTKYYYIKIDKTNSDYEV